MPNIFLSAAVCFFALFGIIQMFRCIINEVSKCRNDFFIVISVKNQQDCIEDIIRTTVWKSLNGFRGKDIPQIYVVDCGSTDNTPEILKRICRDYEFVKVFTREEYISLMEKIK